MSNPIPPPASVVAYAAAYRCHDCTGVAATVWMDRQGIWHVSIEHDDECPILTGQVTPVAAAAAAVDRAGLDDTAVIVAVRDVH